MERIVIPEMAVNFFLHFFFYPNKPCITRFLKEYIYEGYILYLYVYIFFMLHIQTFLQAIIFGLMNTMIFCLTGIYYTYALKCDF